MSAFAVPLGELLLPDDPFLDLVIVRDYVAQFRRRGAEGVPPIEVELVGTDLWRIRNGRHRVVAAMAAGVPRLQAVEYGL